MSARRLSVYLALDTSGSMRGEPIQAVNVGLQSFLLSLRQHPFALESVHLSILTFDGKINLVLPLTPLADVHLPEIVCPESGPTFLGEALHTVCDMAARDARPPAPGAQPDWQPLLFIMTDGKPSDTQAYNEAIPRVRQAGFASVVACAAGPKSVPDQLKQLTEHVVSLDLMDSAGFSRFFQWVTTAVTASPGGDGVQAPRELPPPPPEIQIVL